MTTQSLPSPSDSVKKAVASPAGLPILFISLFGYFVPCFRIIDYRKFSIKPPRGELIDVKHSRGELIGEGVYKRGA